ncbi:MAG: SIR2 family protein [Ignavibacteriales bacterium]|nr:SIR2 family protein [Ignavibacteriales bacterium]
MENVVYITGAGFSAPLNIPVMSNFISKAKDLYFQNPEKYEHFKNVFDMILSMAYCQTYYNADLTNIEEILSILEMQNNFSTSSIHTSFKEFIVDVVNGYTPDIDETNLLKNQTYYKNWFTDLFGDDSLMHAYGDFVLCIFCVRLIRSRSKHPDGEIYKNSLEFLDKIKNYSIITLNYDRVLENICNHINKHYKSESDIKFANTNDETPSAPHLIKLHGCVSTGEIIPPTWNKSLLNKETEKSWKLAHQVLRNANYIRIVGYSLPINDSYIKYLLKSALIDIEIPHLKQIDIICQSVDDNIKNRYFEFINFKDVRFVNKDFSLFLKDLEKSIGLVDDNNNVHSVTFNKIEDIHEIFMEKQ